MDVLNKLLIALVFACLAGCNSGTSSTSSPTLHAVKSEQDKKLAAVIKSRGLTGTPLASSVVPSINDPVAQLGKRLFFSKSLSGNRDTACVTCNHPQLGGGDNLTLPIGVDADVAELLGPGRTHRMGAEGYDGGPTVPRNAPTTFNIALWNNILFHDGRIELNTDETIRTPDVDFGSGDTLAGKNLVHAQARFPITSKEEMKGFAPEHVDQTNKEIREFLARRLSEGEYWLTKFRVAFNQPNASAVEVITEQNISFALGEYQRSQLFTKSPWQKYVSGDSTALSESEKNGALLFLDTSGKGGANCASCHSGDSFTDEGFHNIAMPQMGRGKGDGVDGKEDFGRFRETKLDMDKFAFRTPSLLNVEMTGPWGHAGAYTSLEAVVRHHLKPQESVDEYARDPDAQLSQAGVQNLLVMADNTQKALNHRNFALSDQELSDTQVADLVGFLKALTDPCTKDKACLTPWILDADDPDLNEDQLVPEGIVKALQ